MSLAQQSRQLREALVSSPCVVKGARTAAETKDQYARSGCAHKGAMLAHDSSALVQRVFDKDMSTGIPVASLHQESSDLGDDFGLRRGHGTFIQTHHNSLRAVPSR